MRSLLFSLLLLISSAMVAQLSNGLVGEFLFNGNFTDYSPVGINGTSTTVVADVGHDGISNGSYSFNGTNSSINFGTDNRGVTGTVTMACYVKTTSTAFVPIIYKYDWTNDRGYHILMGNEGNPSMAGTVRVSGRQGVGAYRQSGASIVAINDGQWHCLVGVVTPTTWSIYIDGALASQTTYSAGNTISNSAPLLIGLNYNVNPLRYFDGEIDDVRLWNRALSAAEISSLCGCSMPISFPVTEYTFCGPGTGTIQANVLQADSVFWEHNAANAVATTITYPDSGWIQFQAFRDGSCTGLDSIHVSWNTLPVNDLIAVSSIVGCESNGNVSLATQVVADSYMWNDGLMTPSRNVMYPDSGWFYLTAQFGNCSLTDSVYISWMEMAELTLGPDFELCPNEPATLYATSNIGNVQWFNFTSGPTVNITGPGTYYASVTSACETVYDTVHVTLAPDCDTVVIEPIQDTGVIVVPTAFTPNGDGLNDFFRAYSNIPMESYEISVFDRIGNRVFYSNTLEEFWDGTFQNNGDPVEMETYIYIIKYIKSYDGKMVTKRGYIALLL